MIEVISSHYVEAWRADPAAPDGDVIRSRALATLIQAGERSASLAAAAEARRYFEHALELTEDPLELADLHQRAGEMAWRTADFDTGTHHFQAAAEGFERAGRARSAAFSLARIGIIDYNQGELERGAERLRRAYEAMGDAKDLDYAEVAHEYGRLLLFTGHAEEARPLIEEALAVADRHGAMVLVGQALNTKSILLESLGRTEEAAALAEHALAMGEREGLGEVLLRSTNNLASFLEGADRFAECLRLAISGLEIAARLGHSVWRWKFAAGTVAPLFWLGRWDEAVAAGRELLASDVTAQPFDVELVPLVWLWIARGDLAAADEVLRRFEGTKLEEVQVKAAVSAAMAAFLRARGELRGALEAADRGIEVRHSLALRFMPVRMALVEGIEAALELGDVDTAERYLALPDETGEGGRSPLLEAMRARLGARLLHARGGDQAEVDRLFRTAREGLRLLDVPWHRAVAELEHAEWLDSAGRTEEAEGLLASARSTFEGLGATAWLERVHRLAGSPAGASSTASG